MLNVSDDQAALIDRLLTNCESLPTATPERWPACEPSTSLWLGLATRVVPLPSYNSHVDLADPGEAQDDDDAVEEGYDDQAGMGSDASPQAVRAVSQLDSVLATQFPDPSAAQGVRYSVLGVLRDAGSSPHQSEAAAAELAELLGFDQLDLASALVQHSQQVARLLDPNAPTTAPKVLPSLLLCHPDFLLSFFLSCSFERERG